MTVPDLKIDAEEQIRPKEPVRPKVIRWVITAAILIPLIWSVAGLEISIEPDHPGPRSGVEPGHRPVPTGLHQ